MAERLEVTLNDNELLGFRFEKADRTGLVTFHLFQYRQGDSGEIEHGEVMVRPDSVGLGLGELVACATEQLRDGLMTSLDAIIVEHRGDSAG